MGPAERRGVLRVIIGFAVVAVVLPVVGLLVVLRGDDPAPSGPPELVVDGPYVTAADVGGVSALYLEIANGGGADRLVGVTSPVAGQAVLHATEARDGLLLMVPIEGLPVAAGGATSLRPGGAHVMLVGLTVALEPGDEVVAELRFERAAPVTVRAVVLSPAEVLDRIDAAEDPRP